MRHIRLRRWLGDRGLLPPERFDDALRAVGPDAVDRALLERGLLTPTQLDLALAALGRLRPCCGSCRRPLDPAATACPDCAGAVEWLDADAAERPGDLDEPVPADVRAARSDPSRVFGKYVLLEELGRGGAGLVRKAWDTLLAEYVALKFLREPESSSDTDRQRREKQERLRELLREGRAALPLRHPGIVPIRDLGRFDRQTYLCMDFVEGRTLAALGAAAAARGGVSLLHEDPAGTLQLLRDVAAALSYAHRLPQPIIHCDLKPGNVMVGRRGACLLDFGLARVLGRAGHPAAVGGTPPYMAPEQYSADGAIGPWTDVYAFGSILYELLAGRPVFSGDYLQVLTRLLHEQPEDPIEALGKLRSRTPFPTLVSSELAARLRDVILRCLRSEPDGRYPSVEELDRELEAAARLAPPRPPAAEPSDVPHEAAFREFRERLIERLNAERPTYAHFDTDHGRLENLEILKAEPGRLIAMQAGVPVELDWTRIDSGQLAVMAEGLGLSGDRDRLALAALCRAGGQVEPATRYAESLRGTELEAAARVMMDRLGEPSPSDPRDPLRGLWSR